MKRGTGKSTEKHVYKCFHESENVAQRQIFFFFTVCFSGRNMYGQNSFITDIWVSMVFSLRSVVSFLLSNFIVSKSFCKLEKKQSAMCR